VEADGSDIFSESVEAVKERCRAVQLLGVIAVDEPAIYVHEAARLSTGSPYRKEK
jgi:hypothetical protein